MKTRTTVFAAFIFLVCTVSFAEKFVLLTGVDARHYPGSKRLVAPVPGPGFPGEFYDGDRLAGTSDVSVDLVPFNGVGNPMFQPNEFGSLSMLYRRGSVPVGGPNKLPLMGIEFLGGPLLDLDGDLHNGKRSLIPVEGAKPVIIPLTRSYLDLEFDVPNGVVRLRNIDTTGNNEGAPQIPAETATVLITLAGTEPDGQLGPPINPSIDTRVGTLTPFTGNSGQLTGVYRIQNLGYEFWEDSIDPNSSTRDVLGTLQFLGTLRGGLVERHPATGRFPQLAGEGLGSTRWPQVDVSQVGKKFNTAHGLFGGTATITDGLPQDRYSAPGNGGLALSDFGGDLGAYLDAVIAPRMPVKSARFVYLESAGFGINNSLDPVFTDTVSYDAVLLAAEDRCYGYLTCDADCDGAVNNFDIDPFVIGLTRGQAAYEQRYPGCRYFCNLDANGDGKVNNFDIDPFVKCLTSP